MAMGLHTSARPGRGNRRAPMAEINVTPFVDVMLVLLIVFMVTAPLLTAGVPVDLPDSRAGALPQDRNEIAVSLADDGAVYIDEEAVAPGELPARLESIVANAGDNPPVVTLRADRMMSYGAIMGVMGEMNRAGLNSIALVTNSAVSPPDAAADAAIDGVSGGSSGEE